MRRAWARRAEMARRVEAMRPEARTEPAETPAWEWRVSPQEPA